MKIAAISFLSANDAFSARRPDARSSAYDYPRQGDRRRKPRVCEAVRLTPQNRLITGLAIQVIAQVEKSSAPFAAADGIAAARSAYRTHTPMLGEVVNFRA